MSVCCSRRRWPFFFALLSISAIAHSGGLIEMIDPIGLSVVSSSRNQKNPRRLGWTERGLHIPIYKQESSSSRKKRRRGTLAGEIGLGDSEDVTYSVLVTVGDTATPLVLDTGSSDLWVLSDACTTCSRPSDVPLYPQATFQSVGLTAKLFYGDSQTGTHAYGLIGKDTVNLAGLRLRDQYFAAINDTNTGIERTGAAGIFGLGFPLNSVLWRELFLNTTTKPSKHDVLEGDTHVHITPNDTVVLPSNRQDFPDFIPLYAAKSNLEARQSGSAAFSHAVFSSFLVMAPLLSRIVAMNGLKAPQFTVTLQRETVDIGGNVGLLSIGELPEGVYDDNITWVKVRTYGQAQRGLPPPPDSPLEEYPIAWEIFIDDVYLDGEILPRSNLASASIALSALIDTGNSLLRGPADVVRTILSKIGTHFPCSLPHTLAFRIGGQLFPVDPRDFISQAYEHSVEFCKPNLETTDPPAEDRYLHSWSLGDPFLKGVLSSYYYGNLTYPSRDPPRIGFLSTVPPDAGEKLKLAVEHAAANGGNFPASSERAPTGTPTSEVQIDQTRLATSSAFLRYEYESTTPILLFSVAGTAISVSFLSWTMS